MRIVILDTSSPDECSGGQTTFIGNVLPRLDGEIRVVGVTTGSEPLGKWQTRRLGDVEYDFLPVAHTGAVGQRPMVPLRISACLGVARFRKKIAAAGDVMYVHSPEMGFPLTFGSQRKPMVLHVHTSTNPLIGSRYSWARSPLLQGAYGRLQERVMRYSRLVMCVDEIGLKSCENSLRDTRSRCVLVPTCYEPEDFCLGDKEAARRILDLPLSHKIIVFVGRVEEAKGSEQLLGIVASLSGTSVPVTLVVIGDGSRRPTLEQQARRAGLRSNVVFAGWVEHHSLPRWLQAADVLLLPSEREGFPTVVLEALACGVPIVATKVGGLPHLVEDGRNGFLVNHRTPDVMAAAVRKALDAQWSVNELAKSVAPYTADNIASLANGFLRTAMAG